MSYLKAGCFPEAGSIGWKTDSCLPMHGTRLENPSRALSRDELRDLMSALQCIRCLYNCPQVTNASIFCAPGRRGHGNHSSDGSIAVQSIIRRYLALERRNTLIWSQPVTQPTFEISKHWRNVKGSSIPSWTSVVSLSAKLVVPLRGTQNATFR